MERLRRGAWRDGRRWRRARALSAAQAPRGRLRAATRQVFSRAGRGGRFDRRGKVRRLPSPRAHRPPRGGPRPRRSAADGHALGLGVRRHPLGRPRPVARRAVALPPRHRRAGARSGGGRFGASRSRAAATCPRSRSAACCGSASTTSRSTRPSAASTPALPPCSSTSGRSSSRSSPASSSAKASRARSSPAARSPSPGAVVDRARDLRARRARGLGRRAVRGRRTGLLLRRRRPEAAAQRASQRCRSPSSPAPSARSRACRSDRRSPAS